MKRYFALLILPGLFGLSIAVAGRSSKSKDWRTAEPKTVTLYSRTKYNGSSNARCGTPVAIDDATADSEKIAASLSNENRGYGRSAFSFQHGIRSDEAEAAITRNNYELLYGNINMNCDSDWFLVAMVTDDLSRIRDLGALQWTDITEVPLLPAALRTNKGIRFPGKTETFEESSEGQVTRVADGHMYVVHSKDRDEDLYTLFRVEKLVPSDQVTISWKVVPSPEKKRGAQN
jgi:hypothetical protein